MQEVLLAHIRQNHRKNTSKRDYTNMISFQSI